METKLFYEYIVTSVFRAEKYSEGGGDVIKPSVFEDYTWSDAKIVSCNLVKCIGRAFEGEVKFKKTIESFEDENPIYPKNLF